MNWLCYDAVEVARAMPVMRVMARVLATPTPPPKTATWPCLGSLKALLKIKQSNIFIMLASKVDLIDSNGIVVSCLFDKRHISVLEQ